MIESISAITLATHEMPRAVRFYRALGFEILHGGEDSSFTSFRAGPNYLNLIVQPPERRWSWWGRVIFYASDVDALHQRALRRDTGRALHHAMPNGRSASSTSMTPTAMSLALRGRCGPRCDSRLGRGHLPRGLRQLAPRNAGLFVSSCRWYRATSRRTGKSRCRSTWSDRLDRHSDCRSSDTTAPCRLYGDGS